MMVFRWCDVHGVIKAEAMDGETIRCPYCHRVLEVEAEICPRCYGYRSELEAVCPDCREEVKDHWREFIRGITAGSFGECEAVDYVSSAIMEDGQI